MCSSCETYDHSKNCGPSCKDHDYQINEAWSDEDMTMWTCTRCGSCTTQDAGYCPGSISHMHHGDYYMGYACEYCHCAD